MLRGEQAVSKGGTAPNRRVYPESSTPKPGWKASPGKAAELDLGWPPPAEQAVTLPHATSDSLPGKAKAFAFLMHHFSTVKDVLQLRARQFFGQR